MALREQRERELRRLSADKQSAMAAAREELREALAEMRGVPNQNGEAHERPSLARLRRTPLRRPSEGEGDANFWVAESTPIEGRSAERSHSRRGGEEARSP